MNNNSNFAKDLLKDIIIAVAIALLILQFIKPTVVSGSSMLPNYHDKNYLIVSKVSYRVSEPERGDVIVFRAMLEEDEGREKLLIKRVIGLPGDTITIRGGKVMVNGKEDDQSYTLDGETYADFETRKVGDGEYFCLGDNRGNSRDSRDEDVGNVKRDDIIGKVVWKVL